MKKVILLFLLVLLVPNGKVLMQEIPDCMCSPQYWIQDNENLYNTSNRIIIDTCNLEYYSTNCDSSYWLNYWEITYGKRLYSSYYWYLIFDVDAIPIPRAPRDTSIWVTWRSIDTNYHDMRNAFQQLENRFGQYMLFKTHPQDGPGNKTSRMFWLYFIDSIRQNLTYQNIYTVTDYIDSIPNTQCWFGDYFHHSGKTNVYEPFNYDYYSVFPNPASEYIEINLTKVVESGLRPVSTGFSEGIRIYNALGECVNYPTTAIVHTPAPLPETIGIFDERGIREGVLKIDVSDFPAGVYFVRIGDVAKSFVKI